MTYQIWTESCAAITFSSACPCGCLLGDKDELRNGCLRFNAPIYIYIALRSASLMWTNPFFYQHIYIKSITSPFRGITFKLTPYPCCLGIFTCITPRITKRSSLLPAIMASSVLVMVIELASVFHLFFRHLGHFYIIRLTRLSNF